MATRSRWRALVTLLAWGATLLVALATPLSYATDLHWRFELLTHARPHLAAVGLLATLVWLALRRYALATVGAVLLAANAVPLVPYLVPAPGTEQASGQAVRLLWFNLRSESVSTDDALALIAAENPDIVMLTEVPRRGSLLQRLGRDYPYAPAGKEGSPFYVVTLSRIPLGAMEVDRSIAPYLPVFRVEVCPERVPPPPCWTLVGIHAPRPFTAPGARKRDGALLLAAAKAAAAPDGRAVMAGDFNLTPWSPAFGRTLAAGGLRDAQRGHSLAATWLLRFPLVGLPIDHVLVGGGVTVVDYRVGPFLGSDHLPVIADLVVH